MRKTLERIFWKDKAWRKKGGTKVTPEKIGDSFVVFSLRFPSEEEEKPQNIVVEKLEEYESSGYLSMEQKQKINAYSIGKPMDGGTIRSPISFYKI